MKQIYLLRHGKSARDGDVEDFDRPLKDRGIQASYTIGAFLKKTGNVPELIVSSTANRAKTTAEIVAEESGYPGTPHWEPNLYDGGDEAYLRALTQIKDSVESAMLVGHNPDMEEICSRLCADGNLAVRMPTAALACIEASVTRWTDLEAAGGELQWIVTPRMLDSLI